VPPKVSKDHQFECTGNLACSVQSYSGFIIACDGGRKKTKSGRFLAKKQTPRIEAVPVLVIYAGKVCVALAKWFAAIGDVNLTWVCGRPAPQVSLMATIGLKKARAACVSNRERPEYRRLAPKLTRSERQCTPHKNQIGM
jgi:hypothetical protein